MAYDYEAALKTVTDEMLLSLASGARRILRVSGVATMDRLMAQVAVAANTDTRVAAVERLVDLRYLHEIPLHTEAATQNRVFRAGNRLEDD